jgi:tetrahydromethanopterin S-methyltransferase subunit G
MSEMRENPNQIAELRTVVVDGFAKINARFDGLQSQVDFIAAAVASHDESISEVHAVVVRIERRLDRHEHRIERLEDREQRG